MGSRFSSPNARPVWSGEFEVPGTWADSAACKESGWPDAWFPEHHYDGVVSTGFAKAICKHCPVQQACLEYAMRHEAGDYRWGIYGGLSPRQRQKLARGQK